VIHCPECHTEYDDPPAFCGVCGAAVIVLEDQLEKQQAKEPETDPAVGMIIADRYRIISLVGKGGMGAVYRAEHIKMGKVVAVKLMSETLVSTERGSAKRFEREAEMVSKLTSLNTVQVFDFGTDQGMMYLAMEYLDGKDLAALLEAEGPLAFDRAARILIQAADSLTEAHEKGMIHRDLKPANIFVLKQGEKTDFVKVLDFGVAILTNLQRTRITKQGTLVGTPHYMAPEYISGRTTDERADIYALGAVLYKMLTNETPFQASTIMGTISRHLTDPAPCPSETAPHLGIPKEADAVCLKAMAKEPEDRFASAAELKRALLKALGDKDLNADISLTPSWTDTAPEDRISETVSLKGRKSKKDLTDDSNKVNRRARRRIGFGAAIAAVVLVIIGILLWRLFRDDPTRESEPNNTLPTADVLNDGIDLKGFITANNNESDVDWYVISGPKTPFAVSASVSGIPGIDLALQLVNPVSQTQIASADAEGAGGMENLSAAGVGTPTVYLAVREKPSPGAAASSSDVAYTLMHHFYEFKGLELEPNNIPEQATVISEATTSGQLGAGDADWFVAPTGTQSIRISTAAGLDVALAVGKPSSGNQKVINARKEGLGEDIALAPSGAPVFFLIFEAKPAAALSTRMFQIDIR
jgi:serine/threonine-protein kinase